MPDLVAYNVALSVVARSGRDDVALAMLERMRKDGEMLVDSTCCRSCFATHFHGCPLCSSRASFLRSTQTPEGSRSAVLIALP